jgi:hypothetical protein
MLLQLCLQPRCLPILQPTLQQLPQPCSIEIQLQHPHSLLLLLL